MAGMSEQARVIAFLSRPETFALAAPPRRHETHASIVFIAGERAYKLKRAVSFPYLDFSTPARRRAFCEAELRINRRTAPAIYRGVVAVTKEPDGRLALGGSGEPVDWLVEMTRFDEDRMFDKLASRNGLDRHLVEDLADRIAAFHRDAARAPESGGGAAMAAVINNSAASFAACPQGMLDADAVARLLAGWRGGLATCHKLLDERRADGFVRHCHGDLHLRNIVLWDGKPTLFDAIEFNDAFAKIDVLYDLAFLLMDLGNRGLGNLAGIVFNRYLDNTGDSDGLAALPLFVSLRAGIRAHVDAASARAQSDTRKTAALFDAARGYLALALAALERVPPRLVAVGGLSGSGKSSLARALAPSLDRVVGARVVRSDCIRKRLAGVPLSERLGPDGYSADMTAGTYRALGDEAAAALAAGGSVIADAVFANARERDAIGEVAARAGVPFAGLWLEAPVAALETRVTARRANVSDATAEVVRMQLGIETGQIDWTRIDSSASPEVSLAAARRHLRI